MTYRVHEILDLARWAPSGDNSQPWRFEIKDSRHVVIHGFDTRESCVYDLQGRASQLAIGALLEYIALAAVRYGARAHFERRVDMPESQPTVDCYLSMPSAGNEDSLSEYLEIRATQRRILRTTPLTAAHKRALAEAPGEEFQIRWIEGFSAKFSMARMLLENARLRMITPEAYRVHRDAIEWNAQFSTTRVPDRAVGLDPIGLALSKFALASWSRMRLLNQIPGATLLPRIQLDFVPALACGAHYVLFAKRPPVSIDDFLAAGRAVARVWLTATKLGLWQQPEMTPLIFSDFAARKVDFTRDGGCREAAAQLRTRVESIIGAEVRARAVWMARLGRGSAPVARSTRRSLEQMLVADGAALEALRKEAKN
jgi:sulfur-carrier protein adenylyltransferase/sulfurtransferase